MIVFETTYFWLSFQTEIKLRTQLLLLGLLIHDHKKVIFLQPTIFVNSDILKGALHFALFLCYKGCCMPAKNWLSHGYVMYDWCSKLSWLHVNNNLLIFLLYVSKVKLGVILMIKWENCVFTRSFEVFDIFSLVLSAECSSCGLEVLSWVSQDTLVILLAY